MPTQGPRAFGFALLVVNAPFTRLSFYPIRARMNAGIRDYPHDEMFGLLVRVGSVAQRSVLL